jgi:hypothetical protein
VRIWRRSLRPKHRIRFEQGEPICMLVPEARGVLEQFEPAILELDDNAELAAKYRQWHKERGQFLDDLRANQQEAVRAGWQRDYFLGRGPSGEKGRRAPDEARARGLPQRAEARLRLARTPPRPVARG